MSYKEDTKLEDKLALEAEEEKKFSNSENYEYGGEGGGGSKADQGPSVSSVQQLAAAFNPKDQASKEMQVSAQVVFIVPDFFVFQRDFCQRRTRSMIS